MRRFLGLLLALVLAACARGNPAADFTLTSDSGSPWSLSAQRGKPVALTFGYTHCTDTCPLTLAKLARATRSLGPRGNDVEIVFVTVDPQRDTPAVLGAFLRQFGPGFTGLTGTLEQVTSVEQAYHVWGQRVPGRPGSPDYDEAHGSAIFFIDRDGRVRGIHDAGDSIQVLSQAAGELL
jgi:protein SCO1